MTKWISKNQVHSSLQKLYHLLPLGIKIEGRTAEEQFPGLFEAALVEILPVALSF